MSKYEHFKNATGMLLWCNFWLTFQPHWSFRDRWLRDN